MKCLQTSVVLSLILPFVLSAAPVADNEATFEDGFKSVIRYDAPDRRPVYFGASSRCENVGIGGEYCVYLDIEYADGTPVYALKAPFETGTHGWESSKSIFLPPKPVKEIKAYLLQRKAPGRAWFRDAFVTRNPPPAGTVLSESRRTFRPYRNADRVLRSVWNGRRAETRVFEEPSTLPSRNPLPSGACVVWVADSMRKITPLTFPAPEERRHASVDIELFRRESESAQICISTGDGRSLDGVDIRIGSIRASNGNVFPGRVHWRRVGYFPRTLRFFRHPMAPDMTETWFPEPLLPPAPMKVPYGGTQGAWLTFSCAADAKAGEYSGVVEVLQGSRTLKKIPVSLKVRDSELPARFGMKTGYSVMDGFTRAAYPENFTERRRESWDILLDHRLNPTDISRTTLPDLDMLEYAKKRGMNSFCALHLVPPPLDKNVEWVCYAEPEEIFNEKFYGYLKSILPPYIRELERRGLKDMAYLYGFDERESEYYPRMLEMWKRLRKDFGLPLLTSCRVYRDVRRGKIPFESELATMTDIQCPGVSDYEVGLSDRYRALGREVWWYTCFGPRYPYANNAHYEYPTVECRLLGWMTWTERADGYLFWLVNAWNRTDKLDESETYFPEWNVATALDSPGDGIFIYPGRNGVLPGIRLANVRDGVEDFEKLQIAERKLGRDFVSKIARGVVRTTKDFSREPNDLRAALRRLSETISEGTR